VRQEPAGEPWTPDTAEQHFTLDGALEREGVDSVMTSSGKGTNSTNYLKGD